MEAQLTQQLEELPTAPGIYKYFDADDELIYVGKAVNLKNRVKSYFTASGHSPKTQILVSRIARLETIVVQSEVDALILETNLIKEFRPRYNIILKDDKSHLYIKITMYEDLPRVSTCRQTDISLDQRATYFGPFPSSATVKQTLRYLRRVFPYLARHQPPVTGRRRPPQSYFYYNLPLGPVDSQIDKKTYRHQVFQLVYFLEGKRLQVEDALEREMTLAAKRLDFEQAARLKQQLEGLAYISQATIRPETYIANPELMAERRESGLRELEDILSGYFFTLCAAEQQPDDYLALHRIECYDISNIGGQQAVGSMVVFEDGLAQKSDYRRFKIKAERAPNDVAMLREVLSRRFKRLAKKRAGPEITPSSPDSSFASTPNLIVIDGGKGQLTSALAALQELSLDIPVVGMTKREEELIIYSDTDGNAATHGAAIKRVSPEAPNPISTGSPKPSRSSAHASFARTAQDLVTQTRTEGNFTIIRLARGSEALFLVQRLRDEAHRFAIVYHRKLRSKTFLESK